MTYPYPPSESYPKAIQFPLSNHSNPATPGIHKKLIVLHITQGQTMAGAYNTFLKSVKPNRVSSHFIIDQDGKVYQLLPISDIGFHASEVNTISVGIEHVCIAPNTYASMPTGLPPTVEMYQASAALVKFLCSSLGLGVPSRAIVQGHNEASPKDLHVHCCEPLLSVDKVIELANLI